MGIKAWNASIEQEARQHQDQLTKPQGSLGRLEDIACWFSARQEKTIADPLTPHVTIFAADHGVTAEGISAFPSVVTTEMVKNFAHGGAAINILANQAHASLAIVDVGVLLDTTMIQGVVQAKVRCGTANLLHEQAMSEQECTQAMQVGRDQASKAIENGANLLIAGDMGIGNTTASACLICLFTEEDAEHIVGRGTGIDKKTYRHKVSVVNQAVTRVTASNTKPASFLHEVGGLEIAAMCGYYLEAAEQGVPVIIDGFITGAAALAAQHIEPNINQWMLASHLSQEPGHQATLKHLNIEPLVNFNLRLGEGSGATLIIPLLQSALALHREMATFESAGVSDKDTA
ncbi:MAG: nicotinate-nucleotide--dimethylbenzimidazole phosphoribosyltransferase [Ghiorsea sp.]